MQVNHARTVSSAVPQIDVWDRHRTSIPRTRCSRRPISPAHPRRTSPTRATCTRLLTGRITAINGTARLNEDSNRVRLPRRPRTERVRHERGRPLRAGLMAAHADLHAELRPALGAPAPHEAAERLVLDVDRSRISAADPAWASGPGGRGCNFFQPGVAEPAARRSTSSTTAAIPDTTPTGTISRRTSASRGARTCRTAGCGRSSAIPSRRRSAAATRWPSRASAWIASRASTAANPGAAINANRTGNQSNLVLPGESWPILISQTSRLGPPPIPSGPQYPLIASLVERQRHQHLRSGDQGAEHALLVGRHPARARRATWRSTSATSARG